MPVIYGSFDDDRFHVEAFMPCDETELNQWTIRIFKDTVLIRQETIPMDYVPTFGPDVSDVAVMEERTDQLLKEMNERG